MKKIDLHTHSHYSDGTSSPAQVVRKAFENGVRFMALADHDTISGFEEADAEARNLGVRLLCGVEINTCENEQVHILGYGVDWKSPPFLETLEDFRARRLKRMQAILEKLGAAGIGISMADIQGVSKESLGRPHVADALRQKGLVRTRQEAFRKYLVRGKAGYVEPMGPTPQQAIEAIRKAGGIASFAHPGLLGNGLHLEKWAALGLEGLEVYYPAHSVTVTVRLSEQAQKFSLLATGGSDYHGPGSGHEDGIGIQIPEEVYNQLLERFAKKTSLP